MKLGLGPMPWDMVVFFSITTVGFGYSVQRIMNPSYASPSAQTRSYETAPAESSHNTLDLGCVETKLRSVVSSEEGSVRLRGKFCNLSSEAMKDFASIRVKNVTTGVEGTVFFQGVDNAFVTDFLSLKRGRNFIHVEWRESRNSAPRTYVAEVLEK